MGPNIHVDVTWRTLPTQAQVHLPMTVALPHGYAPPAGQFALPHCKNCSGKKGQGITLASEFSRSKIQLRICETCWNNSNPWKPQLWIGLGSDLTSPVESATKA